MASEDARLPPARPPESCAMYQMDDIDDAFLSGKKWNLVYKSAGQQTKKFTDILLYNFSKTTSSYNNNKKNTKSMKI